MEKDPWHQELYNLSSDHHFITTCLSPMYYFHYPYYRCFMDEIYKNLDRDAENWTVFRCHFSWIIRSLKITGDLQWIIIECYQAQSSLWKCSPQTPHHLRSGSGLRHTVSRMKEQNKAKFQAILWPGAEDSQSRIPHLAKAFWCRLDQTSFSQLTLHICCQ